MSMLDVVESASASNSAVASGSIVDRKVSSAVTSVSPGPRITSGDRPIAALGATFLLTIGRDKAALTDAGSQILSSTRAGSCEMWGCKFWA
eukprot:2598559-Rhodomonas_salina.1